MNDYGHFVCVNQARSQLRTYLAQMVGDIEPSSAKGRKRLQILDAAAALFVRQGYRKTSIDEVAREAGVAKGTVYLYFSSKNELILAASAREKLAFFSRLEPIFDDAIPAAERLKFWIKMMFELSQEMPLASALLRGDRDLAAVMADIPRDLLAAGERIQREILGDLIRKAAGRERLSDHEVDDRMTVFTSLIHLGGAAPMWIRNLGMDARRYASILADMVVGGLSPRRHIESHVAQSDVTAVSTFVSIADDQNHDQNRLDQDSMNRESSEQDSSNQGETPCKES